MVQLIYLQSEELQKKLAIRHRHNTLFPEHRKYQMQFSIKINVDPLLLRQF